MGRGESQPKVKIALQPVSGAPRLETKLRATDVDRGSNFKDIRVESQSNLSLSLGVENKLDNQDGARRIISIQPTTSLKENEGSIDKTEHCESDKCELILGICDILLQCDQGNDYAGDGACDCGGGGDCTIS